MDSDFNYWPIIAFTVCLIYSWQFLANRFNWTRFRPSMPVEWLAAVATRFTMWLGRMAAYISSFVEYLRFEMFYVPLFQLLKPMYDLCMCWLWFFSEYAKTASAFSNQYVIYWGSFLIIMLITDGAIYAFSTREWVTYWEIVFAGFAASALICTGICCIYMAGIALHEIIKGFWNGANKNNALLVEKGARPKPVASDKNAAETAPATTPASLPTTDKKEKKNKN